MRCLTLGIKNGWASGSPFVAGPVGSLCVAGPVGSLKLQKKNNGTVTKQEWSNQLAKPLHCSLPKSIQVSWLEEILDKQLAWCSFNLFPTRSIQEGFAWDASDQSKQASPHPTVYLRRSERWTHLSWLSGIFKNQNLLANSLPQPAWPQWKITRCWKGNQGLNNNTPIIKDWTIIQRWGLIQQLGFTRPSTCGLQNAPLQAPACWLGYQKRFQSQNQWRLESLPLYHTTSHASWGGN